MDNFNEYLKGSRFMLYKDLTTETTLGTTQLKTLNRLRTMMTEHDFELQDRQSSDLPDFVKKKQTPEKTRCPNQDFNKTIHVDLINISTNLGKAPSETILSITDDSRTFCKLAIIPVSGLDSTASAIYHHWCQLYGFTETIFFNQGKVQTSRLESRINELMPLGQKINCRSKIEVFNHEVEQQW
jgi:hypothetical protein